MKKITKIFMALVLMMSMISFLPLQAAAIKVNQEYSTTIKNANVPETTTHTIELTKASIISLEISSTAKAASNEYFDASIFIKSDSLNPSPSEPATIMVGILPHDNQKKSQEICLPKGKYQVSIYVMGSKINRNVKWKVNCKTLSDNFVENGYEKNNNVTNASSIALYKQYNSALMCEDAADCYKVSVPLKAKYDLTIQSSMKSYNVFIHKKVNNQYLSVFYKSIEDGKGFSSKNTYSITLEPGTYYITVEDFPGLDTLTRFESGYYRFSLGVKHSFKDLDENMWYYTTALQAYQTGLMTGTDNTHFSPNANMSRAMVASVLHRIAGGNSASYKKMFSDVKNNMWYTSSIMWAAQNGVVNGYDNGKFGVDDPITREQMCAMCYKFVKFMTKKDPVGSVSLTKFKDDQNVTSNMKQAMSWAVANGIISGSEDGYLNPTAKATRAQCAKMLLQLSKLVGK